MKVVALAGEKIGVLSLMSEMSMSTFTVENIGGIPVSNALMTNE